MTDDSDRPNGLKFHIAVISRINVKRQGLGRLSLDYNRLLPSDRGASLMEDVGLEACRKDLGEYKDSKLRK
jgi:hypothetical protein